MASLVQPSWRLPLLAALLLIPALASAFLLPAPQQRQQEHTPTPSSHHHALHTRLSATAASTSVRPERFWSTLFDPEKAARLGAFSFSVYGNPSGARYFRAKDGSDIGFSSDDVVRNNFQYLLFAHIKRARDLPAETNLVDRVMQGSNDPDPIATIEVLSSHGSDVAITTSAESSRNPEFYNARYFLYVEDLATAKLKLTVKDHNNVGGDDLLGLTEVPLADFFAKATKEEGKEGGEKWEGWIDIKSPYGKPRGSVEVAFELVALAAPGKEVEDGAQPDDQEGEGEGEEGGEGGGGPKGRVEELNWDMLAAKIRGGTVGGLGKYSLATFLNNEQTDTQGAIWMNKKEKELVVCFRGTEIGWKDLLTDALILQQPLDKGLKGEKRLIHSGFNRAFKSIKEAVYTALYFIVKDDWRGWKVDVCGHSLGGALATLMAHDLAGRYPELAQSGRLQMYSYGSPRVGNTAFCEDYDSKLGDASFRVVNNQDIVARVPRATRSPSLIEYDHIGRTVLISFDPEGQLNVFIEGQTPGTCPLRQIDRGNPSEDEFGDIPSDAAAAAAAAVDPPLNLPSEDLMHFLNQPISAAAYRNGSTPSIGEILKLASNFTNLQSMMSQSPVGMFGKMSLQQDLKEMTRKMSSSFKGGAEATGEELKKMALGSMGMEEKFFASEVKMMESLVKGDGLNDHYEDRYYHALEVAFADLEKKRLRENADLEKKRLREKEGK